MRRKRHAYKMAGIYAAAFLIFAVLLKVVDVRGIGADGTNIGFSHLNGIVHTILLGDNTFWHLGWYYLTQLTGLIALAVAGSFALIGLYQLVTRRSFFKVDRGIYALAAIYIIVVILYGFFEVIVINYRPCLMPGATHPEASFPSTHTLLAVTIFGTALIEWNRLFKDNKKLLEKLNKAGMILLAVTVIGRLLSGVHWFTDIVAGILLSLALINLYKGLSISPKKKAEEDDADEVIKEKIYAQKQQPSIKETTPQKEVEKLPKRYSDDTYYFGKPYQDKHSRKN